MATLTGAGLAAALMGVPKAKAAACGDNAVRSANKVLPLEDFTYALKAKAGWPKGEWN